MGRKKKEKSSRNKENQQEKRTKKAQQYSIEDVEYHIDMQPNSIKKPQSKPRQSVPQFLYKTYEIVENLETQDICSWSEKGDSFLIKNVNQFCEKVLLNYFKTNNFASFVRQLNMYGFHKIRNEQNQTEFQHKKFLKGQKQLLIEIKRKQVTDHAAKLQQDQEESQFNSQNDLSMKPLQQYGLLSTEQNPGVFPELLHKQEYNPQSSGNQIFDASQQSTQAEQQQQYPNLLQNFGKIGNQESFFPPNTNGIQLPTFGGLQAQQNQNQPAQQQEQGSPLHQARNADNPQQTISNFLRETQNKVPKLGPGGNNYGSNGNNIGEQQMQQIIIQMKEQQLEIMRLKDQQQKYNGQQDSNQTKLQHLEKAVSVIIQQHESLVEQNRLLQEEVKRNREKEENNTQKILHGILQVFQIMQNSQQKVNPGLNPAYTIPKPSNVTSPSVNLDDSKVDEKKSQREPGSEHDKTKIGDIQVKQEKSNKEDWSTVSSFVKQDGEKIPMCNLKSKKKREEDIKLKQKLSQAVNSMVQGDQQLDQILQQSYQLPKQKLDIDQTLGMIMKRQNQVNLMPDPSKKVFTGATPTDGRKSDREANGVQTPGTSASFGPNNVYGGYLTTPTNMMSPLYENNLNIPPYIFSGGNSPNITYPQYIPSMSPLTYRNDINTTNELFNAEHFKASQANNPPTSK